MDAQELEALRQQKHDFFKTDPKSPLTPEQQVIFEGLNYYPYNPQLDLTVTVTQFEDKSDIQVQTSSGQPRWYRRYGEFTFDVNGETVRLTIYQAPHGFFLPFVDGSAGDETYPSGRYIEPEQLDGDTFHIDFNQVYNPYCAYSTGWSCPITPAENRTSVKIEAGEKLPPKTWAI
jgi:uncharacterized protein (DUF1684 family)